MFINLQVQDVNQLAGGVSSWELREVVQEQVQVQDRLRDLGESFSEKSSKLDYDKGLPPPGERVSCGRGEEQTLRILVQELYFLKTMINDMLPNNELCTK
jgi:hypothetical protein